MPTSLESFFEQEYLSEETALREAIQRAEPQADELIVFDLVLKSRKTLQVFDQEGISFVTRGANNLRYEFLATHRQIKGRKADGLHFLQVSKVFLYAGAHQQIAHPFRLVEAQVEDTGEHISFLTNVWQLSAIDIARFYRFIKQELNVRHLINRSENGVRIQLYLVLITAILVMVYRIANNISSYKIAKIKFEEELWLLIIKKFSGKVADQLGIAFLALHQTLNHHFLQY